MITLSYNGGEMPPAPYVDVEITSPIPGCSVIPDRAKLDSGAAVTVIPGAVVAQLSLAPIDVIDLRSFDGRMITYKVYEIDLTVGSRRFTSLLVISTSRQHALLGRDVMNQLLITLDGHQLTLTVHDA